MHFCRKTGYVANMRFFGRVFTKILSQINKIWLRLYLDIGAKKWRVRPLVPLQCDTNETDRLSNVHQRVCQHLVCATSLPDSSRSCWRTAKRTTFPGSSSVYNCVWGPDSGLKMLQCIFQTDPLWFKTNAIPSFLPERCEPSVERTGLFFRCTS